MKHSPGEPLYVRLSTPRTWHEGWLSHEPKVGMPCWATFRVYQGKYAYREEFSLEPILEVGSNFFRNNLGKYHVSRIPPPTILSYPPGFRFRPPGIYVRLSSLNGLVIEGYIELAPKIGDTLIILVIIEQGLIVKNSYYYETPKILASQGVDYAFAGAGIFSMFTITSVPPLTGSDWFPPS
jgi:hypothetical protein